MNIYNLTLPTGVLPKQYWWEQKFRNSLDQVVNTKIQMSYITRVVQDSRHQIDATTLYIPC